MSFFLNGWGAELRHALRTLRRTPGFTATVVGTLGLAIGTIAGVFTVLDRVLLAPLPYGHPERLVYVAAEAPGSEMNGEFGVAAEFYLQYKEASRLLEDVATYNTFTTTLRIGDRVERIRMAIVTNSLYSTLGAQPALGRLPVAEDESRVVVISDALWRSWFGADPSVLGRTYDIAGESRTIVGVMRPEFQFPNDGALLWIVLEVRVEGLQPGRFGYNLVGRMAPGADREAVAAELTALARRLPERFGGSPGYARLIERHRAVVRPLLDEMLGPAARSLWILFAAAAIVLLIACVNVANLFMVRAEARQRDLAVRRAIGASRAQLVRLQMAEALVAALLGGGSRRRARRAEPAGPAARRAARHPAARRGRPRRPARCSSRCWRRSSPASRAGARRRCAAASPDLAAPARGRPRLDRAQALDARRAGGGPDRDGAGAADRRGAADAQLPGAARGRSRLRHARRLHVPVRAGAARAQGRPELGALPPRLPRPAGGAPGRDFGRAGRERAPRRGHARRSLPQRGHAGRPGRRPAAQLHVRGRRLLPHDGDRRGRRPAVRDRRPRVGARERGDQPLGGPEALARAARRRPPPAAAGLDRLAHRRRRRGGRDAVRLPRHAAGARLLPAGGPDADRVVPSRRPRT